MKMKPTIIIAIILICLGVGGLLVYKNLFQPKIVKPGEDFPISPRQSPPNFIKGLWMPTPFGAINFGFDNMKKDGINTFGTQMTYQYKEDGSFSNSRIFEENNKVAIQDFKLANRAGIKTWMVVMLSKEMREPQPLSAAILKNSNLLKNYNKKVIEAAKLAEEYQIDFFSPFDEPDYRMCAEWFWDDDQEVKDVCNSWIKDIVPKIRKVYHGKIIFKGALNGDDDLHPDGYDYSFIDVSDYDYLGFTVPMMPDEESQREMSKRVLGKAFNLTEGTNTKVIMTEFGAWGEAIKIPEKEKIERETVILEEVKDKVKGICIGNYPESGGSIKNTPQEELIKRYFTEVIKD